MYLTSRPSVLPEVFRVSASYMPSNNEDIDPYVNSMLWSRRFIGLRLFLSLASAGWEGYEQHVEHGVDLICYLNSKIIKHGWTVANHSPMAVSCLVPPKSQGSPQDIAAKIISTGSHWVSLAQYEGRPVLRVCITNGRTSRADIDGLIDQLIT